MTPEQIETTARVAPLDIQAAVGSVDDEARTVELIFSTGEPFERYDWLSGKRYMVQLSLKPEHVRLGRLNGGAPILDSHSGRSVTRQLGVVVEGSSQIKPKRASVTARFSRREDVEPIWQDIRDGIIRNVSVGARIYRYIETQKPDELPLRTAVDWEPFEVSMVPMGADSGARVAASDQTSQMGNPCVIVRAAEETHMSKTDERSGEHTPESPESVKGSQQEPQKPVEPPAEQVAAAAKREERARLQAIDDVIDKAVHAGLDPKIGKDIRAAAIEGEQSVDQVRAAVFEKLTVASGQVPRQGQSGAPGSGRSAPRIDVNAIYEERNRAWKEQRR